MRRDSQSKKKNLSRGRYSAWRFFASLRMTTIGASPSDRNAITRFISQCSLKYFVAQASLPPWRTESRIPPGDPASASTRSWNPTPRAASSFYYARPSNRCSSYIWELWIVSIIDYSCLFLRSLSAVCWADILSIPTVNINIVMMTKQIISGTLFLVMKFSRNNKPGTILVLKKPVQSKSMTNLTSFRKILFGIAYRVKSRDIKRIRIMESTRQNEMTRILWFCELPVRGSCSDFSCLKDRLMA